MPHPEALDYNSMQPAAPSPFSSRLLIAQIVSVLACVGLVVLATWVLQPPPLQGGTALEKPVTLPPLPMTDEQGHDTTLAESDGKVRLMMFSYSRCTETCPALLFYLKNIYNDLSEKEKDKLQIQIISIDPEYDKPPILKEYLSQYEPKFKGLTGTEKNADKAAEILFAANIKPQPIVVNGKKTMSPRMVGDEIRVINTKGEFVRVYNNPEVLTGVLKRDVSAIIRHYQ